MRYDTSIPSIFPQNQFYQPKKKNLERKSKKKKKMRQRKQKSNEHEHIPIADCNITFDLTEMVKRFSCLFFHRHRHTHTGYALKFINEATRMKTMPVTRYLTMAEKQKERRRTRRKISATETR